VLGSRPVLETVRSLIELLAPELPQMWHDDLRWCELAAGERRVLADELAVTAIPASHRAPNDGALGIALEHGETRIAYSGDTRPHPALVAHARGAALLIHEATFRQTDGALAHRTGHSTAADAGRTAEEAGVGALLLVHLNAAPTQEADSIFATEAATTFSGQILVPPELTRLIVRDRTIDVRHSPQLRLDDRLV
jgi:ribonuclease Z